MPKEDSHIQENINGAKVYADYAHHPSAVRVTVEAARKFLPKTVDMFSAPHPQQGTRIF